MDFLRDWKKSRNQNGDMCTCSHLSFFMFFLIWYKKKTGIWVKHEYHQLNQWKTWYYGFLQDWKKIQKSKWKMERGVPALTFHFFVFFIFCKPVLVEGNKDQIFGESCTISSNKKQSVLNQFECWLDSFKIGHDLRELSVGEYSLRCYHWIIKFVLKYNSWLSLVMSK